MKWKVGDFGRFLMEDPKRPRFEVIRGVRGRGVEVWYGGSRQTTIIPPDVFRSDCTKVWAWRSVDSPNWIRPGVSLLIHSKGAISQANILIQWTGGRKHRSEDGHVETKGQTFLVRQIHHDYVSCLATPSGVLALIAVEDVVRFGFQQVSAWDRISQEEDWMNPYSLDDDDLSDITVE